MVNGDFPAIASPACASTQRNRPAPFVNNQILPSLLSSVALNLLKKIPRSEILCGRYQFAIANNSREHQVVGKMDYIRSKKNTLFERCLISDYSNPNGAVPGN